MGPFLGAWPTYKTQHLQTALHSNLHGQVLESEGFSFLTGEQRKHFDLRQGTNFIMSVLGWQELACSDSAMIWHMAASLFAARFSPPVLIPLRKSLCRALLRSATASVRRRTNQNALLACSRQNNITLTPPLRLEIVCFCFQLICSAFSDTPPHTPPTTRKNHEIIYPMKVVSNAWALSCQARSGLAFCLSTCEMSWILLQKADLCDTDLSSVALSSPLDDRVLIPRWFHRQTAAQIATVSCASGEKNLHQDVLSARLGLQSFFRKRLFSC